MEKHNLQAKCITDFDTSDTIYLTTEKHKGHPVTSLCNFIAYKGNRVIGQIQGTDTQISAYLESCSLYGKNPITDHTHYHHFMASGYAIYPSDMDLESENAKIIEKHPAYGMIGISRTHIGGAGVPLFGSSLRHNELITLRIHKGKVSRNLGKEWYSDEGTIIEVELSQNQFAEFITTANVGSGVPCTISRYQGQLIPEPPYQNKKDFYSTEFKITMQNKAKQLDAGLERAREILEKKSIGKADKEELMEVFNKFVTEVGSNIPHLEKSFLEQMDKTVTEAKGEIEAFVTRNITEEGRKVLFGENGSKLFIQNDTK